MQDVGYAALQIIPSFKGLDQALEQGTSKAMLAAGTRGGTQFGDAAGRSAGQRFGRMFATTAKAGLIGVGALAAVAFKVGKDSIEQASDLNESLNAVNVTYKDQAIAVQTLGRQAAESLGLSNVEFNNLAVRFSAFSKTVAGGDGPQVVKVLDDLTTRASDFASVMNLEVNEAAELFQSGLAGETEPLRRFGVELSAAAVQAHAYKTGIAEAGDELTESEKIQARYSLLMKQTSQTQGDFANTSDQLANQQRILNARWDDARARLGIGLLPLLTDATKFLNDKGIPAFEKFADWFRAEGGPAIYEFIEDAKPIAKDLLPEIAEAAKTVGGFLKDAAGYADDFVGAFNDMPDWAKTALVGGGAAAFAGKKLGLGAAAGALTRGAGSVLSSAKPVPVFVTNPGFGGVPGTGGKPGVPPVVPGGLPGPTAKLPKFAPLIPLGLDSAPGQDSLLHQLTGFGPTSSNDNALDMTPEMHWRMQSDTAYADAQKVKALIESLPTEIQTRFITQGVPQSASDVLDLRRQYDLTPKQVRTLFQVAGISSAEAALARAQARLEALDGRTYRTVMELHTVRTGAGGQGIGFDGYADGGYVRGPGGPRGDKIPAWLSDREFVVNAASTAKHLPLLRRINADRFANGGLVGGSSHSRSAVMERVIERVPATVVVEVDGTPLWGRVREVANDEYEANGRFDGLRRAGRG